MDFENMTKNELIENLIKEYNYIDESEFIKTLIDELPRRMVYRIISKLYRKRNQKRISSSKLYI